MRGLGSLIPEIDAFQRAQAVGQQQQSGQLQQMGALQGILQRQQAMQQEQELKGVLSKVAKETGGDPAKMGPMLMQTGNPQLMKLGQQMMPKQAAPQFVNTVDAQGNPVQQAVVPTPGMTLPSQPKTAPNTTTELEKLMMFRDRAKAAGQDTTAIENAIRKVSEVSGQIVPRVHVEAPVSTIVVKDPSSSTGWSYKDARTGRVTSQDAPAPAGDTYARSAGSAGAKDDVSQHDAAIAAATDLPKINNLVNTIKTSQAVTGLGADVIKNIERAKVLLANDKKAGKIVSDTEYLDALMGSEVFSMIKPLGIGARGLDTPSEREFLRKVMTGEVSLNKETLLRMAETRKAITERAVAKWNSRVKSGELDPYFRATGRTKGEVGAGQETTAPTPAQPAPAPSGGGWKITPVN